MTGGRIVILGATGGHNRSHQRHDDDAHRDPTDVSGDPTKEGRRPPYGGLGRLLIVHCFLLISTVSTGTRCSLSKRILGQRSPTGRWTHQVAGQLCMLWPVEILVISTPFGVCTGDASGLSDGLADGGFRPRQSEPDVDGARCRSRRHPDFGPEPVCAHSL